MADTAAETPTAASAEAPQRPGDPAADAAVAAARELAQPVPEVEPATDPDAPTPEEPDPVVYTSETPDPSA